MASLNLPFGVRNLTNQPADDKAYFVLLSDLLALPIGIRVQGQLVYVEENQTYYVWNGGVSLSIADWVNKGTDPFSGGSASNTEILLNQTINIGTTTIISSLTEVNNVSVFIQNATSFTKINIASIIEGNEITFESTIQHLNNIKLIITNI